MLSGSFQSSDSTPMIGASACSASVHSNQPAPTDHAASEIRDARLE